MARRTRTQLATVLFTDIVGSSEIAVEVGDRRWAALLEGHNAIVRRALRRHGGRELDTAGDGFFAVFDRQAEAIRCAVEIVEGVRDIGLEVRAGLHVGEAELIGGKVGGVAVHTGARVGAVGGPGQVVVSSVLRDLVPGAGIDFEDLGARRLKGLPGEIRLWSVRSVNGIDLPAPLPAVDAAERRERVPVRSSRRGALVIGGIAGLAVLIGLAGFITLGGNEGTSEAPAIPAIQPNTLVRVDPTSMGIEARYDLSGVPIDIVFSADRIWILEKEGILEVVEAGSPDVQRTGLAFKPCSIAPADGGVIVGDCSEHRLYRVDTDLHVKRWIDVPPSGVFLQPLETSGGLWVLVSFDWSADRLYHSVDRLYHIDPTTGDVLGSIVLPDSTQGVSYWEFTEAGGFLWTFNYRTGAVLRIAPSTSEVTEVESVSDPNSIASNGEWVWLADWGPGETLQIDPANGDVVDRTETAGILTATEDGVWALALHVLTRVNDEGEITGRMELPYADDGSWWNRGIYGNGAVWIAVQPDDS